MAIGEMVAEGLGVDYQFIQIGQGGTRRTG
jgi:hypothetical protein